MLVLVTIYTGFTILLYSNTSYTLRIVFSNATDHDILFFLSLTSLHSLNIYNILIIFFLSSTSKNTAKRTGPKLGQNLFPFHISEACIT